MRRRSAILVGFLLLGAIVNVAVAWLCATITDFKSAPEQLLVTKSPDFPWWISDARREMFGFTQSVRRALMPTSYGIAGDMYVLNFNEDAQPTLVLKPGQTIERDAAEQMAGKQDATSMFIAIEPWMNSAGWPARSMCCWLDNLSGYPSSNALAVRGQVTLVAGLNPSGGRLGPDAHVLPLRPLWGGLLMNTVFYAIVLFAAYRGAVALRSHVRLRRGQCPHCAYPIGASRVCTECGRSLPSRTLPASR